jgi:purine-binding chemotaxis protein CheW
VAGVINLRGRVLPVVDLRARFGLPARAAADRHKSRIVVIETGGMSTDLIVDGVSEVLRLPVSAISPPSHLVASSGNDCLAGICRLPGGRREGDDEDERLILLLGVARLARAEELDAA